MSEGTETYLIRNVILCIIFQFDANLKHIYIYAPSIDKEINNRKGLVRSNHELF
jgi:hypothetical protein